jgi:hypothetical protein
MALSPRLLKSNKSGRTIYYTGLGDGFSWDNLNNWSTVSHASNIPITSQPGVDDTVIINSSAYLDASSYNPIIKILIQNGSSTISNLSITVLQYAIFNDNTTNYIAINGEAIFNEYATNAGEINGNATFNDSSSNNGGTVNLNAIFNDTSIAFGYGAINGSAIFNNSAVLGEAVIGGSVTFNNNASNYAGLVYGLATFTGNSCTEDSGAFLGGTSPSPPPVC